MFGCDCLYLLRAPPLQSPWPCLPSRTRRPDEPANPGADSAFLDSLSKAGMTCKGPDAVAAGRIACDMMNQGLSQDVVSKLGC